MTARTTVRLAALSAILASTITVGVGSQAGADAPRAAAVAPAPPDGSATDQIIVTFDRPGRALGYAAIAADAGPGARSFRTFGMQSEIVKLTMAKAGPALEQVMASLARRPGVTAVEADQIMRATVVDPLLGEQWSLAAPSSATPAGIDVAAAWSVTTGDPGLRVAVIDTGYLPHADLAGKIVGGYDFIGDTLVANDGDGRDPDASDPGDWITSQESRRGYFRGCPSGGSSWHGTHVAGTIGAATDNGEGVAGVNPGSMILPVRVLGKCGGYTSDIVDGMRWAAGLPVTGVPANQFPARVLNLSLGGGGSCSATYQSAVADVRAAGAVVVVAAGNSDADAAGYSPASCPGVITVAATGKAGDRSYYSNYGDTVELAAPGGDRLADNGDTILSTLNTGSTSPGADTYVRYQGTSMATPHVAGVVSLMLSANDTLDPADIDALLPQMVRQFPAGSTCTPSLCGAGLLDAGAAVAAAAGVTPPTTTSSTTTTTMPSGTTTTTAAPTTTSTTTTTTTTVGAPGPFGKIGPAGGDSGLGRRVTMTWQASSGAAGYQVCIDTAINDACDGAWQDVGSATAASVSGLGRSTTYEWQVRALGAVTVEADADGDHWTFTTR